MGVGQKLAGSAHAILRILANFTERTLFHPAG
jgi:hypothetical protein